MTNEPSQETEEYKQRAEYIMPHFSYWGSGVVLVSRIEWEKSNRRICAILKQLHRAKIRLQRC